MGSPVTPKSLQGSASDQEKSNQSGSYESYAADGKQYSPPNGPPQQMVMEARAMHSIPEEAFQCKPSAGSANSHVAVAAKPPLRRMELSDVLEYTWWCWYCCCCGGGGNRHPAHCKLN